jgi:YidC/Oxa1 family membrane protein insertase
MQIFSGLGDLFNLVISRPLGFILYWCYYLTRNYGLALLLFTFVTRLLLFPLAIKQQKSSSEMVRLQPKLATLQKKYAKDKQKLQEAQMKLYQEEGYNPMGGCLPLLIQMPILFGLFNVIYRPYTFIMGYSSDKIKQLIKAVWDPLLKAAGSTFGSNPTVTSVMSNQRSEIILAGVMKNYPDKVAALIPTNVFHLDFNFLWLDLTQPPNFTSIYILIPIVCYVTSLLSTWMSMKMTQAATPQGGGAAGMNKSMLLIMPFVSAFFSISVPAGVGFYWIATNLFMMLQVVILNKFYNTKDLAAKAEEKSEKRKAQKRLSNPVTVEEEIAEIENEPQAQLPKNIQQKKPAPQNYDGKKTKKQLMEENRRRLSAAREREKKKQNQ